MLGLLTSNSASQQLLTKPVTLLILKNHSEDSHGFSSFSRIFRWSNPLVFQHQNPPHWRGCFLYPTPTHIRPSPEGLQLAKYVSEIRASPGVWGGRVCVGCQSLRWCLEWPKHWKYYVSGYSQVRMTSENWFYLEYSDGVAWKPEVRRVPGAL